MPTLSPEERIRLKKEIDAKKIADFELSNRYKHGYDYEEWRPWTGNSYIKSYYDAMLPDGTIIQHCWPNAGVLRMGIHQFDNQSKVMARLSADRP